MKTPHEFSDEVYNILYAIWLISNDKAELDSYKLKDVTQTWYTKWRDNRNLRAGWICWEVVRRAFLEYRFIQREKREAKVEEFINLCQRGMNVL